MNIEATARSLLSPSIAQKGRQLASQLRYRVRLQRCRTGYQECGERYTHSLLFVAGLPKSGTSWLESMLASYPGYQHLVIPEAVQYELRHKGSHDFQLPYDTLDRFKEALVVLKLHVNGSVHNARILHDAKVPYVVMYRDLRDVAVSHYFYVRRTPWHPEYEDYSGLDVREGLCHFGRTLLPDFVDWMRSWRENRDPDQSIEIRYEDLLSDTFKEFRRIGSHYSLDTSPSAIKPIVEAHSFESMSGGRSRGNQDPDSFTRKGIAGDWQRHFTEELKDQFKEHAGQALIDFGYETDLSW